MSILFIGMLVRRRSREGQSLTIAVNKWIGTLAPTALYGVLGEGGFSAWQLSNPGGGDFLFGLRSDLSSSGEDEREGQPQRP
jgi:hypothetical protein